VTLYKSPDIVRVVKYRMLGWPGPVGRMGNRKNEYKILMGKHLGRRPHRRPRRRWKH